MKTVMITGASSGIGLACVELFARKKMRIIGLGRDGKRLKDAMELAIRTGAPEAMAIALDFSKAGAIEEMFERESENIKGIDYLINSAGVAELGKIDQIDEIRWDNTFAVNVRASFSMIKAALPYLQRSQQAAVVNVSSIAGRLRSISLGADYTSSKAALIGMTRHLASELGPKGIRVNCICPSQTHTPMLDKALSAEGQQQLGKNNPLGRLGTPLEQAEVIHFLCSEQSSYMNGAIVDVNGGAL